MRIGYARVSTLDQNHDLQIEWLREAGCKRIVTERASGARTDRPELARLLADTLREGDTLVVWKLARLARSLSHLIAIAAELEERRIGLASLTDGIDTSSPGGILVFHTLGAIAEFEHDLIRQRTRAGLIEAKRKGKLGGRPRLLKSEEILAARLLMNEGTFTSKEVASRFQISKATLYRYLAKNKVESIDALK